MSGAVGAIAGLYGKLQIVRDASVGVVDAQDPHPL
jgi:hypothetical protein